MNLSDLVKCKCPHNLGDCDSAGDCPCYICHIPYQLAQQLRDAAPNRRAPKSPVGPEPRNYAPEKPFVCDCGHGWNHHDDYGCLWSLCQCPDMGERK